MVKPSDESRPDPAVEEEPEGGPIKTFLEHLEDLRWTLIKIGASLLVGMAACFAAAPTIIEALQYPLINSKAPITLQWIDPLGGLAAYMKIALYGGATLSLPLILYCIGDFVMPALKRNEKKYVRRAFIIGGGLFMSGVMLCYFLVLPISLIGIVKFNTWLGVPTEFWRADQYFSFVIMFMVGMGVSFEFPVIMLTLVRVGVISHRMLVKGRAYFLLGNFALCAFITPDFISTFFMVIPVQVLMEICILISAYWERQKRAAEARGEKDFGGPHQ